MTRFTPMSKATSQLLITEPFYANLLMTTEMVATEQYPRAATDMVRIFYNPKFIGGLTQAVVIFVILHELLHIILMHGTRRNGRDPELWNVACDYAINYMLHEAKIELWKNCLFDARFAGMTAEKIYDIIKQEDEDESADDDPRGIDGSGDDPCGDSDSADDGAEPPETRTHNKRPRKHRLGDNARDVLDPAGVGAPGEIEQIEQHIAERVAQAANAARMMGKMPAYLDLAIQSIVYPDLSWEDLLRDYMQQAVRADSTWMRRNRRFEKVYLPSQQTERMGPVIIIGDTSGSMYSDYPRILGSVQGVVDECDPEKVTMIWADTVVAREEEIQRGDEIDLHPAGGGGTDMRVPLEYVADMEAEVVILITDGETPWPDDEPPYPLIVICTTEAAVPVGQVVRI